MKVKKENTLKYRLEKRIFSFKESVFLRSDIADLSTRSQISRALKSLVKEGKIARISYGVYARLEVTPYSKHPILEKSLREIAKEVFKRCNVQWELTEAQKEYNAGKTTQVPVRVVFRLKSRFRRNISYGDWKVNYEENVNAK